MAKDKDYIKTEILETFRDINFMYNNASMYEYLVKKLNELTEADDEVVRCENCKRFERNGKTRFGNCSYHQALAYLSDFCSWAERRTE